MKRRIALAHHIAGQKSRGLSKLILSAVLCITASFPVYAQSRLDRVTIGLSPTDVSSGPLYAEAAGAFAKHGIAAEFKMYPLNDAQTEVAKGNLDVGFSDLTTAITMMEDGAPLKIVASGAMFDVKEPVNVLIAPKDRPVKNGADLNGKKSGVPRLRSFGELATRNWVDRHGGDSKTLTFVVLPFGEFEKALNDGRIDVGPISEPLTTMFAAKTSLVGVSYAELGDQYVYSVYVAHRQWVEANPDLAARFVAAMNEGNVWANEHRPETAKILSSRYNVPPDIASKMARARFPDRLTPELIQPVVDLAARYGFSKTTDAAALLR